jgi:hypothetical protein
MTDALQSKIAIDNRQFPHSSLLSGSLGQQVKKALFDFLELSFECQVG